MFEEFILHSVIKKDSLKPRGYQVEIASKVKRNNLLCVIPTGLGKTIIGVLATAYRLEEYPNSKAIILAPSKPLVTQNHDVFKNYLDFDQNSFQILTGTTPAKKRKELYQNKRLLFLTPQTLQNDLKNNLISLGDVSIIVFDECHRSIGNYAYVYIAQRYNEQSKFPRILGLTASPGSDKEKIDDICKNILIDLVEIKTESDESVKDYLQKKEIEWINVELPESFKKLSELMKTSNKRKLNELKKFGVTKPLNLINKKDLLQLQNRFREGIKKKNLTAFYGISVIAQIIKLQHAIELLETQSLKALQRFFRKLKIDNSKAAKNILKEKEIIQSTYILNKLIEDGVKHPKLEKLIEIIGNNLTLNKDSGIIVFANFRDTVNDIVKEINKIEGFKAVELLGQKEGITQKKQIETIKKFEEGVYNVLVTSSIGEEGLSIKGCELSVFFDHVYGLRRIQRAGRVGRTIPGKIIFLITKGTRDEAMYWKSKRDISKMQYILKGMQANQEKQKSLQKF